MTTKRVLFFWSVVVVVGALFYQGWNLYSPAEKWLYLFGRDATTYATSVLSSDDPHGVPVPQSLAQTGIAIYADYVLFSAWDMQLAFSLQGRPAGDVDSWQLVKHNWFLQVAP